MCIPTLPNPPRHLKTIEIFHQFPLAEGSSHCTEVSHWAAGQCRAIAPTPGAWLIPKFISLAQVVVCWTADQQVNGMSNRSCMIHTKINLSSPGWPRPSIALQCRIVPWNTIHLFIHSLIKSFISADRFVLRRQFPAAAPGGREQRDGHKAGVPHVSSARPALPGRGQHRLLYRGAAERHGTHTGGSGVRWGHTRITTRTRVQRHALAHTAPHEEWLRAPAQGETITVNLFIFI